MQKSRLEPSFLSGAGVAADPIGSESESAPRDLGLPEPAPPKKKWRLRNTGGDPVLTSFVDEMAVGKMGSVLGMRCWQLVGGGGGQHW